jgi:hypothetical protein
VAGARVEQENDGAAARSVGADIGRDLRPGRRQRQEGPGVAARIAAGEGLPEGGAAEALQTTTRCRPGAFRLRGERRHGGGHRCRV